MRKTPPGRAVIVGKGVGVTAQVDPARPPQGRQWWRPAQRGRREQPARNRRKGLTPTATGLVDGVYARRTQKNQGKPYMYFDVDDSYAAVGDRDLEIAITARPFDEKAGAGFNLVCETSEGYRATKDFWTLEKSAAWQTHTFRLTNANFANNWGWNFRIEAPGSASDVWVRQVVVKRVGAKK